MTLDKLYDELLKMVPLEKCGKTDFLEYLQKKLHDYRNLLDNVDEEQQLDRWKQIVKNVDDLLEIIVPSIKHIFEGQHGIAFKLFSERVIEYESKVNSDKQIMTAKSSSTFDVTIE